MAQNLAGGVCIGQLNACVVRMAKLDPDCTNTGGVDSGVVTAALAMMTATPEVQDGTVFEPKTACGAIAYTYEQENRVKRYDLAGEFLFFDYEMMQLMFGGPLILGAGGGPFAGKVIGYADPLYSAAARNGIYLEVITQNVVPDLGDCVPVGATGAPAYTGHIFGKAKLIPGARTFENDVARVTFTGKANSNAFNYNGPWNDYPGAGYSPNSAYIRVGYSAAQYATILATVACGYQTLPVGS